MKDEELVEMFCNGDERAIGMLIEQYGRRIYNRCLSVTRRHEDAQECYNDCLYNLWLWIPKSKPYRLDMYIMRVAVNVSMDLVYHNRAIKRNKYDTDYSDEMELFVDDRNNMECYFDSYCIRRVLNSFYRNNSPDKVEIFKDRYYRQAKIKDIAKRYNISNSSAKMILMRMREKLRKDLAEEDIYF